MPAPLNLRKVVDFDDANGELLVYGRRQVTVDLVGLCRHLDSLVGERVAGTIVGNHGREFGKEDVARIREARSDATLGEIIEELTVGETLAGYGVVNLKMSEDQSVPVELHMRNPIIKASTGTAVKFILSYWVGVLGTLVSKTFEIGDVSYDANANTLTCRFGVIGIPQTS
jgi:hypothetical protein